MLQAHHVDPFYRTRHWRFLRWVTFVIYGYRCRKCGKWGPRYHSMWERIHMQPHDYMSVDHVFARARGEKGKALQWKWWNLQPMHLFENEEKCTRFEDYRYGWIKRLYPIEDKP